MSDYKDLAKKWDSWLAEMTPSMEQWVIKQLDQKTEEEQVIKLLRQLPEAKREYFRKIWRERKKCQKLS